MVKGRNEYLDTLKGLLIFLVVWGHSIHMGFGFDFGEYFYGFDDYFHKIIYSLHMPLFMGISGYLFYFSNRKSFGNIVKSKLISIGIPYMVYCTIALIYSVSALFEDPVSALLNTYKNGFWFLTSILLNSFLVAVVTRAFRSRIVQMLTFALILVAMVIIPGEYLYNTHAYMFPVFVVGYFLNEYKVKVAFRKWMIGPAVILLAAAGLYFNRDLYVYTTGISIASVSGGFNYPQLTTDICRWAIALVNSLCFMVVIRFVNWGGLKQYLHVLSRYSIGIYCMSGILQMIIYKVMAHAEIVIPYNYVTPIVYAVAVTLVCERILSICERHRLLRLLFLGGR